MKLRFFPSLGILALMLASSLITAMTSADGAEPNLTAIPFADITPDGLLKTRAELSLKRLQESYYQWVNISKVNFGPYPGDAIGRTINALTLSAQALHRPATSNLLEIVRRMPELSNSDGYLGPKLPDSRANEDALGGHNGYACGMAEYARWTKDQAALDTIKALSANLFAPARKAIACYRDPSAENTGIKWHLSGGDIGQLFLILDGMTRIYSVAPAPELKETIETAIERYRKLDLVGISAQIHSMLSATTGILRWHELQGRPGDLAFVEALYKQYRDLAMTETYENYNWFNRPTHTEGCAVVDSFILSVNLWKATGHAAYLEDAHLILFNGLLPGQLRGGGFGVGPCVGSDKGGRQAKPHTEAPFCCTMRGAEGLARAVQYGYFLGGNTVTVPFYNDSVAVLRFPDGICKIRQATAYPHRGDVRLEILESTTTGQKTLRLFRPSWIEPSSFQVSVDGKIADCRGDNAFAELPLRFKAGTVITATFRQLRGKRTMLHPTRQPDAYRLFDGPLLLGSATSDGSEPWTPILDIFGEGGRGGAQWVCFRTTPTTPSDRANAATKTTSQSTPIDKAMKFRRDTPGANLPHGIERLFAEFKHDRSAVICGYYPVGKLV